MRYDTPIEFYKVDQDEYKPGELNETSWKKIAEEDGTSTYYCNWIGTYGSVKAAAMTAGINETVSVIMPFAPALYAALRDHRVVIFKGAADIMTGGEPDRQNPDCYELYSGVDNRQNRTMNFILKRYEGK